MEGWACIKKAAQYADVSVRTMRDWLKEGLKHSRLPSGTIRIRYSRNVDRVFGAVPSQRARDRRDG